MSTQYTTEPPPTATVLLHNTAGPLTISLFAAQTPLTCRNFLQHCLDNTYSNVLFHRISPGFVIQTGDPTGTGEGGTAIYEDGDASLERYGEDWGRLLRLPEEKYNDRIVLGDEFHSRLKFNRRGLVGMARMTDAKSGPGQYGSQFFITLGDCRAELDGKCTMFGRVEGDGIYNVMKIAEGERMQGTERAVYPEKILRAEVVQMPDGKVWEEMKPRERVAARTVEKEDRPVKKTTVKKKAGKALLSFGDDEDVGVVVKPKKAKFNTALIDGPAHSGESAATNGTGDNRKRKSLSPPEPRPKRRKPSFHDSITQLPLRNAESPSHSPSPVPDLPNRRRPSEHKSASVLEAEIAALKQSMKRDTAPAPAKEEKKSALEAMIPATSMRGRKRPRPGETGSGGDSKAMSLLNAFRSRLERANKATQQSSANGTHHNDNPTSNAKPDEGDEEAALCDLHFIANCQSCSGWHEEGKHNDDDNDEDKGFMGHSLTFEKDRLGKDLTWKQKNEDELVVIDPREREKELGATRKRDGRDRDKGGREWDRGRGRETIRR